MAGVKKVHGGRVKISKGSPTKSPPKLKGK